MSNTNDDDIFHIIRFGNPSYVRLWLDNVENDFNICDDHNWTLLHWASWDGKLNLVELLIQRGAKLNSLNSCNDTPLHCAVKNGHYEVVNYLIKFNISGVNAINLHGNTPLHYACYYSYLDICIVLVNSGGLLNLCNRYSQIPLDLCKKQRFLDSLLEQVQSSRQNLVIRIPFNNNNNNNPNSLKLNRIKSGEYANTAAPTSSANLIDINDILTKDNGNLESNPTHQTFIGGWQSMDVIIKILRKSDIAHRCIGNQIYNQSQARVVNSFQQEYKKLRIFNCNNILPVFGLSLDWPDFLLVTQYMPNGTLFNILHKNQVSLVMKQKVQIALDIAKGMSFLHQLDASTSPFIHLNSKHVALDQDFQAKINLSNYNFETLNPLNRYKSYSPAWQSPEVLVKPLNELNKPAANMWSFAICLWELYTSKIPFEEFLPMRCGLAIARDNLRIQLPNDMSSHWQKLIRICMNEEPSKRPKFEAVIPILEKLRGF